MTPKYTYPGVYVKEIPSGARPIAATSTSHTAFIDFFDRGPVNEAVRLNGFGDFERKLGGLHADSEAGYAIQQYFLNGGRTAFAVRVLLEPASGDVDPDGLAYSVVGRASVALVAAPGPGPSINVTARSEGTWGNDLFIGVVHPDATDNTTFGLTVREYDGDRLVAMESYDCVNTTTGDAGNIATIVNAASDLIEVKIDAAGTRPGSSRVDADVAPAVGEANTVKLDDLGKSVLTRLAGGCDGATPGSAVWMGRASGAIVGSEVDGSGMFALNRIAPEIFNIMCIPAAAELDEAGTSAVYAAALGYCKDKRAFLIVDPPAGMNTSEGVRGWGNLPRDGNAASYFPRLSIGDALSGDGPREFASSGTVAGIYARTDVERGVWKAPAGIETRLLGANLRLSRALTGEQAGVLNARGVNALRNFPQYDNVVWGGRTLAGADGTASEWKYVPVRRTALFIEEALIQGLQWVVFEPNDEPLWSQIRLNVGDFLQNLFRKGAFQGAKPDDAYFVKVDGGTTTRADIEAGVVNVVVGFAPLRPAEFVVIKISQRAGRLQA